MRQRIRSRLTYANVISTLALFLVVGGGTTLAANGGNFILGQSNSAGNPTQLSSPTTNAGGALKVANTSTTTPGRGITAAGGAGGYGLYASGGNRSKNTAAMHGQSGAGNAIEGFSTANPASGVFGQDNGANSYGVAGHSDNGVAVVGDSSSGWAFQALGNATQVRDKGGFVKAMAFIDHVNHPSDPIQQCFNAGVAPSQATGPPGNCGITYSSLQPGTYNLDFGFQVSDRFATATSTYGALNMSVSPGSSSTQLSVGSFDPIKSPNPAFEDSPYYIIVF
jgi:hypothetical protein